MRTNNKLWLYVVVVTTSIIVAGLTFACSKTNSEKVTLSPQSLIALNLMSKEDAAQKLKKEGWERTAEGYNKEIYYYKYRNPNIAPDGTYIEMSNSDSNTPFRLYTDSEDIFKQWNNSLKEMGYNIRMIEETKYGSKFYICEKDSQLPTFDMSVGIEYADERLTIPVKTNYTLGVKIIDSQKN